jgi:hypothetical protein
MAPELPKIAPRATPELVAAVDRLLDLEADIDSLEAYQARRQAQADDFVAAEIVLKAAGEACADCAEMRSLYDALFRYGLVKRTPIWCSVATSSLDRTWKNLNNWRDSDASD